MILIRCDNPECGKTEPAHDIPDGIKFPAAFIRLRTEDRNGNRVRVDACRRACLPGASKAKNIPFKDR